jgi:hypothetical protein
MMASAPVSRKRWKATITLRALFAVAFMVATLWAMRFSLWLLLPGAAASLVNVVYVALLLKNRPTQQD